MLFDVYSFVLVCIIKKDQNKPLGRVASVFDVDHDVQDLSIRWMLNGLDACPFLPPQKDQSICVTKIENAHVVESGDTAILNQSWVPTASLLFQYIEAHKYLFLPIKNEQKRLLE